MKRFFFHRRWLWVFGTLLAAVVTIFILGYFAPQILTVDSGPVTADVLVVLGGGTTERCGRAVELFRQQAAPKILVSGAGSCVSDEQVLIARGVPATAIILECDSHDTFENAKFSVLRLRQMRAHRVVIVTSWYHSRRALACFAKLAPGLKFYSRPAYDSSQHSEWKWKTLGVHVGNEYLKLAGYAFWHGVWPG